ncbi:hypothetical protein CH373_13590 [Leptospira perolatii]|uniref:Uncharacterized protein n=1 Tax=Leptospira perolatii TaxID=2023191 RepID=A0A2M9ZK76_9LEPT|nr:tetratricopeptide repeat protein [Leptospira perolatii]PJZ69314.1 hypothetical protein CH360_11155 [Leptospira perolatii]PJZ72449.1 hypothetical protein CH373_13590 [Leptospira perolatii]
MIHAISYPKLPTSKIFLGLFAFIILSFLSEAKAKETIEWIKEGESALKSRNYSSAYDAFREAVQKNPQSVRSHMGLSEAALRLHKEVEAIRSLDKVLELEPKNRAAVKAKATTLIYLGDLNGALQILQPFLEEDRYDPDLFPVFLEVHLAKGNTEKANYELNAAIARLPRSKEMRRLEAKVAALSGSYSRAQSIRTQLESESSDDPNVFLESGIFLLHWAENLSGQKRDSKIAEAAEKLERSIALFPDEEESLRLLSKTRIYSGRYAEAKDLLNHLLQMFPNSTEYLYLRSYCQMNLSPSSPEIKSDLEKLAKLDDLDPIVRTHSETYSLDVLPEGNGLRRTLGEYRLQRYRANKNSFLYDLAWYHLQRANDLLPNRPEILVLTLDEYKRRGLFPNYFNLLLRLRSKFPDNQKYGYAIENNLDNFKKTLSYREGLVKIGDFGIEEDYGRTPPELLIFDPENTDFFGKHPDAPVIAGTALRNLFLKDPRVKAIDLDSYRKSSKIKDFDIEPYSGAIPKSEKNFSLMKQIRGEQIRFVAQGKISLSKDGLRLEWSLRDHKEEKTLGSFQVFAKGRDALAEVTTRSRDKLLAMLPAMGRVHRVKADSIIINAGSIDGVSKGSILYLYNTSTKVGEATVQDVDLYTSKAIPTPLDSVLRTVAVGDRAYWHKSEGPSF